MYTALIVVLAIGLPVLAVLWFTLNRGMYANNDHSWSIGSAAMYATLTAFVVGCATLISLAVF